MRRRQNCPVGMLTVGSTFVWPLSLLIGDRNAGKNQGSFLFDDGHLQCNAAAAGSSEERWVSNRRRGGWDDDVNMGGGAHV